MLFCFNHTDCGNKFIALTPGTKTILENIGGYPNYPAHAECFYRVTGVPGHVIKIEFVSFQISAEDSLKIHWLTPDYQYTLINVADPVSDLTAETREVSVDFRSDGSNEMAGYQIAFRK